MVPIEMFQDNRPGQENADMPPRGARKARRKKKKRKMKRILKEASKMVSPKRPLDKNVMAD